MLDGLYSNGIQYEEFLNGSHIVGFDLTTSGDGGSTAFVNPNVRIGELRLALEFSDVIPSSLDLELLVFAEMNAYLQISKDGSLECSFSTL